METTNKKEENWGVLEAIVLITIFIVIATIGSFLVPTSYWIAEEFHQIRLYNFCQNTTEKGDYRDCFSRFYD